MAFTIRKKLFTLSALGTGSVLMLTSVQWLSGCAQTAATTAMATCASALRNHMEADMMHDAMRGDVLAALLARSATEHGEIGAELAAHARTFAAAIAANEDLPLPPDIGKALRDLHAPLDEYVAAARLLTTTAATDQARANALLPTFLAAFRHVEEAAGAVSDRLEAHGNSVAAAASASAGRATWLANGLAVANALLLVVVGQWLAKSILRPLGRLGERIRELASGDADLTQRLNAGTTDELGQVADGIDRMLARLQQLIGSIRTNADSVLAGSRALVATSDTLTQGTRTTQREAADVAAAAEEMSATLQQASRASQESAQRVTSVTTAVEQLRQTADEVAQQAQAATLVADQAATIAGSSNTAVAQLGTAASEIGRVITAIQDIADQTNLLALNATIEAARAGEAGKGFAVVANEVKALAAQTSAATQDIRRQIEAMQGNTQQTVTAIAGIVQVIGQVNAASHKIAGLAGEQRTAMAGIAGDVAATAKMVAESSEGILQSARVSAEIAGRIDQVDRTATTSLAGCETAQTNGKHLTLVAGELGELIGRFRT